MQPIFAKLRKGEKDSYDYWIKYFLLKARRIGGIGRIGIIGEIGIIGGIGVVGVVGINRRVGLV